MSSYQLAVPGIRTDYWYQLTIFYSFVSTFFPRSSLFYLSFSIAHCIFTGPYMYWGERFLPLFGCQLLFIHKFILILYFSLSCVMVGMTILPGSLHSPFSIKTSRPEGAPALFFHCPFSSSPPPPRSSHPPR